MATKQRHIQIATRVICDGCDTEIDVPKLNLGPHGVSKWLATNHGWVRVVTADGLMDLCPDCQGAAFRALLDRVGAKRLNGEVIE